MATGFDPGIDPSKLVIGFGVDNSGLKQGLNEAKTEIGGFANTVSTSTAKSAKSMDTLGEAAKGSADKATVAQERYLKSLERRILLEQTGGRQSAEYQRAIAQQLNVPAERAEPLLKQLEALQKVNTAGQQGLQGLQQDLRATRAQANLTANALRQVPAQFTDIAVSLAGGQAPLTVLLQQGGQLKDVFGGVGAAAQALGGYILGLINPFTVLVGAGAALILTYESAAKRFQEFEKALVAGGDRFGLTAGQLSDVAREVGAITGRAGDANEAVLEIARNGGVAAENLGQFAASAVNFQKQTGQSVAATAKAYADLAKDPLRASIRLNESTRFLTKDILDQVRALEEQGKTAEAAAVAQLGLADAQNKASAELKRSAEENVGFATRAYRGLAAAFNAVKNDFLSVGSDQFGPENQLRSAEITLARLQADLANGGGGGLVDTIASQEQEVARLRKIVEERQAAAKASKDSSDALAAYNQLLDVAASKASAEEKAALEIKRIRQLAKTAREDEIKGSERYVKILEAEAKAVAAVQASVAPKGGDTREAQLNLQVENIRTALEQEQAAITAQQAILEARRSAGLVGERAYYEERVRLIATASDAAIAAIDDEIELRNRARLSANDQLENEKKIVDLQGRRAALASKARTDAQVADIETQARQRREINFYVEASLAQERYLDDLRRRTAEDVGLIGRGNRASQDIARERAEAERFNQRIRDLQDERRRQEGAGTFGEEARRRYDFELELLRNFQSEAVRAVRASNEERLRAEQDWANGASRALENYIDDVNNASAQTERLLGNAFKGAEDAFVEFATTAKLSFSDLANSIVNDLIRIGIQRQITGQLAQAASSFGGTFGLFGNTSNAGPVIPLLASAKGNAFSGSASLSQYSNGIYDTPKFFAFAKGAGVFGEAGPEAIMPLTRTPDGNLGVRATGGSGVTVNIIESNERGGEVQRRSDGSGGDILDVFVSRVKAEVANDIRRGSGPVPAALSDTYALNRAPAGF